jgi:NAD(P)H-dependent FMN reductase
MGGDAVHVLGLSGSLRNASYNTGLLRAASELHSGCGATQPGFRPEKPNPFGLGVVTDEGSRKQVASLLQALKQWAMKLR